MAAKSLLLCLVALILTSTVAYDQEDHVIILHDADFPKVFQDFPNILIEFYAPWCGHCKQLAPVYTEVAKEIHEQNLNVRVAKVDATEEKEVASKYKIQGFPTLIYFSNDQQMNYDGQRTKEFMVNWLRKKVTDPVSKITKEVYDELQKSDKVSIVFHGDIQSEQGKSVAKIALTDDYNMYYHSSELNKNENSVEMFRPFSDEVITYETVNDGLQAWIKANERPLILPFDSRTISHVFHKQNAALCFFNSKNSQVAQKAFEAAAKAYSSSNPDKLSFTELDSNNEHLNGLADYIKVDAEKNFIVLVQVKKKLKYVMSTASVEQVTEENLTKFMNSWGADQLTSIGLTDQIPSETPKAQEGEKAPQPQDL